MMRTGLGFLWLAVAAVAAGQSPLQEAVARAEALAGQGRYAAAGQAYGEALSLADPHNGKLMAGLFYELARAKGNGGDIQGALVAIQQARAIDEQEAYATLHAELQRHQATGARVTPSGQIRDALASAKGGRAFGVAGARPKVNVWVGFEYDSAELTSQGRRQASEMADAMLAREFDGDEFLLVGHTDARGAEEYNFDLSLRRASSLRDYLVERFGFRAGRIQVEGRGEREPLAAGDSASDHARNRRVEIQVVE